MTLSDFFHGLGHLFTDYLFLPFEWVGNLANYSFLLLGFFGFFFWMMKQAKFNKEAEGNPNQRK